MLEGIQPRRWVCFCNPPLSTPWLTHQRQLSRVVSVPFNAQTKATWGGKDVPVDEHRQPVRRLRPTPEHIDTGAYPVPAAGEARFYLVAVRLDRIVFRTPDRRQTLPYAVGIYCGRRGRRAFERDHDARRDEEAAVDDPDAWTVVEDGGIAPAIVASPRDAGDVTDPAKRQQFRDVLRECHDIVPEGEP